MRRWILALCAVVALPAATLHAADGDSCPATGRQQGTSIAVTCTLVCDEKDENATTCSNYTISAPADTYVFELASATDCSGAASVDIDTMGLSTTDEHNLTALTVGGTTQVVIDGSAAHPLTVLDFDLSTMTACTDFTVKLWRFNERR